jgi:hypothetical protein
MFETLFGAEVPLAVKVILAFVIVIALIGLTGLLVRRFGAERFGGSAARGRQPRLAVVDQAAIDGRRRLVIIRRDNVEHLVMIGGPTDVVVEQNIVRAMGAPRDKTEPSLGRGLSAADALPRPVPLGEGSMWPLQPQPETNGRSPRPVAEESVQWSWPAHAEPPRPVRGENLTNFTEEPISRPAPQREPSPGRAAPPLVSRPAPTPPAPVVSPAEPAAAAGDDQNLTEMAHRLEAALRRPPEPRVVEPRIVEARAAEPRLVEPRLVEPPVKVEPVPPRVAPTEAKPAKAEAKPSPPKALYDSLEEEMASLLGRPPGKT